MLKRRLTIALLSAALVALLLPAGAHAQKVFRVKDARGHVRGTVRYSDLFGAQVRNAKGGLVGVLSSEDSGGGSFYGVIKGPGYVPPDSNLLAFVYHTRLYPKGGSIPSTHVLGKVVRKGERWIVMKKVDRSFRKVGSVPAGCRGPYAVGAGRHLLW